MILTLVPFCVLLKTLWVCVFWLYNNKIIYKNIMQKFKTHLYNLATDQYNGWKAKFIKLWLSGLAFVYELVVRLLVAFYKINPWKAPCKIISVGNITLGGTGKTPIVEYVARQLNSKNLKVAIVTRGYGRKNKKHVVCLNGKDVYTSLDLSSKDIGDEPLMLSKNLASVPVVIGANRIKSIKLAVEDFGVDAVILDDGFQQWKIKKDLEIVAVNSNGPFGNRSLIPRGILREPLSSLKRADIFILTNVLEKINLDVLFGDIKKINSTAPILKTNYQFFCFHELNDFKCIVDIERLKHKKVSLFSGVGNPYGFEKTVKELGLNVVSYKRYADHYVYSKQDIEDLVEKAQKDDVQILMTTQKDAIRLHKMDIKFENIKILVMLVKIKFFDNEGDLNSRLFSLFPI